MPEAPRAVDADRIRSGLTWATRGLIGFLSVNLLTAAGLVVLIPLYGLPAPTQDQTVQLEGALLLLSWALLILAAGSGVVYAVGLAGLWATRQGFGREHASSVEQTLPWLAVTMVFLGTGILVPTLTGPFLSFPGVGVAPPDWTTTVGVVLAGLRAIFAGLTLYYAVQALAEEDARVRLLVAMSLGVAGAIVWSGLATIAGGSGALTMNSLLPFLAGILAGLGTSAISIGLFTLVYREIRNDLGPRPARTD